MTPPDTSAALMAPNPCSVCGLPITKDAGTIRGTGDGSMKDGGSFAHNDCYWRQRAETTEATLAAVVKERDEARALIAFDEQVAQVYTALIKQIDPIDEVDGSANWWMFADEARKYVVKSFAKASRATKEADARADTASRQRDEARAALKDLRWEIIEFFNTGNRQRLMAAADEVRALLSGETK